MKKIILSFVVILLVGFWSECLGQVLEIPADVLIKYKWQSERDEKSRWEFKNDGKMYSSYLGYQDVDIYNYTISSTPPSCPDAQLSDEDNLKYLKLIDQDDGNISCFYIYGLTDERLTVMDAVTGHIFPMVKAVD